MPLTGASDPRTTDLPFSSLNRTITITLAVAFFLLDKVSGFKREFSVTDTSLRHPFAVHERVPDWALYIIAVVAPLALQWAINLLTVRSLWDAHSSSLGVILGLTLAGAFTQVVKITVGRPRPDLLDRCHPALGTVDPPFGLSSVAICNPTSQHMINDGFRSFPSGHSSLSFAGLTFLSLYTAGKLHLFDSRGHAPKAWISVLPLFGASLVAISRTMDYRHHWQDVTAGSILGIVCAYFSYRLYYPNLSSETAHLPYAPRIQRLDNILPTHHRAPSDAPFLHVPVPSESLSGGSYRDSADAAVELLDGTVRRDEPGSLNSVWKQGSSAEDGRPRS
ncbi:PAP2-domain-containing protein [Gloeopeniophorella convolvens]|nr:PAP2-domain-containing protein [Gloeopeniophorella convolvens]